MADLVDLSEELATRNLGNNRFAVRLLNRLHAAIHTALAVHFYEETDQDVEKVLDIFIRVNSGGTVLSYSDLLLSIATAQWSERDARKEIQELLDALNATGAGFRFPTPGHRAAAPPALHHSMGSSAVGAEGVSAVYRRCCSRCRVALVAGAGRVASWDGL